MKYLFLLVLSFLFCCQIFAQNDSAVYSKFTSLQNRTNFYNNLINKSITKNLSYPLNFDTEDKWQNAFSAIELVNYQQNWINKKLQLAADSIEFRTPAFQQSFIEMLYAGNRKGFFKQINKLISSTGNTKIFTLGVNYLLLCDTTLKTRIYLQTSIKAKKLQSPASADSIILSALNQQLKQLNNKSKFSTKSAVENLFKKEYLYGNVVLYSIQNKNRNYPGIVIVKDTSGNYIKDSSGALFYTSQLARSLSNMPYYISNGNTPQGIYRLSGFGKSNSSFIGPTQNLQLTMPFEKTVQHFLKDSTIIDTVWSKALYAGLLPKTLKNYEPLYQSFIAGAAGRTEIIAHGTAVDPSFYTGKTYYPYTPTAGCLCTREFWNDAGKRSTSDQQLLINAVKKAGGANGYLIVIELNDEQKNISVENILPYLPLLIK